MALKVNRYQVNRWTCEVNKWANRWTCEQVNRWTCEHVGCTGGWTWRYAGVHAVIYANVSPIEPYFLYIFFLKHFSTKDRIPNSLIWYPREMADLAVAPEPPAGFTKPPGYMAMRCQFCSCWSTMPTPFTHERANECRFYPVLAWYQGTRDCPKGFICLICSNVAQRTWVYVNVNIFCKEYLDSGYMWGIRWVWVVNYEFWIYKISKWIWNNYYHMRPVVYGGTGPQCSPRSGTQLWRVEEQGWWASQMRRLLQEPSDRAA